MSEASVMLDAASWRAVRFVAYLLAPVAVVGCILLGRLTGLRQLWPLAPIWLVQAAAAGYWWALCARRFPLSRTAFVAEALLTLGATLAAARFTDPEVTISVSLALALVFGYHHGRVGYLATLLTGDDLPRVSRMWLSVASVMGYLSLPLLGIGAVVAAIGLWDGRNVTLAHPGWVASGSAALILGLLLPIPTLRHDAAARRRARAIVAAAAPRTPGSPVAPQARLALLALAIGTCGATAFLGAVEFSGMATAPAHVGLVVGAVVGILIVWLADVVTRR